MKGGFRDNEGKPWHSGRILFALARHFSWWQNKMVTEFDIDGGRADLLVVSRANYATEIEVKVTLQDWRKDREKEKFKSPRPHIARVFYAVPDALHGCLSPDAVEGLLPEGAGLLLVYGDGIGYDQVREIRAARRFKAQPMTPQMLKCFEECFYYRFWRQHMEYERLRLIDRPRPQQIAAPV